MLDMDTNGRVDMLESKTPSNEFREFIETIARIVLLALDIPYSAYNSAGSSFSGIMADQNMYEVACKHKRRKNKWDRKQYSDWLVGEAWDKNKVIAVEGDLPALAEAAGLTMKQVKAKVEWISSGMPWLQKMQEIQGEILTVASGTDNPVDISRRHGTDFYDNIMKTSAALKFAEKHGVPLVFAQSGARSIEEILKAEVPEEEVPNEL
jgi:capsid protein